MDNELNEKLDKIIDLLTSLNQKLSPLPMNMSMAESIKFRSLADFFYHLYKKQHK